MAGETNEFAGSWLWLGLGGSRNPPVPLAEDSGVLEGLELGCGAFGFPHEPFGGAIRKKAGSLGLESLDRGKIEGMDARG